jgi:prevent-host-death family protein
MMTKQIGIREAKTNLSRYLGMVKQGREIILTERGHPIGKIVPMRQDEIPLKNRIKKLEDAGILDPKKNIKNVTSPIPVKASKTALEYLQEDRENR